MDQDKYQDPDDFLLKNILEGTASFLFQMMSLNQLGNIHSKNPWSAYHLLPCCSTWAMKYLSPLFRSIKTSPTTNPTMNPIHLPADDFPTVKWEISAKNLKIICSHPKSPLRSSNTTTMNKTSPNFQWYPHGREASTQLILQKMKNYWII